MTKDRETKRFIIEPHSPYYLHPFDGPGVLITAEIFDGENYDLWENAVRTALKFKNKLGFINGILKKPEVKEGNFIEYHTWDMVSSMVRSWLLNMIERKLRPNVAYAETAQAMREDLQKQYGVANTPKIYQLKARISKCRQGGMSVVEFYSKLRGLWSELDNHQKIPRCTYVGCTCKRCKCKVASRIMEMFEADKPYQFLLSLNNDLYYQIRGQILATDPPPSIEKIFNIVTQENSTRDLW